MDDSNLPNQASIKEEGQEASKDSKSSSTITTTTKKDLSDDSDQEAKPKQSSITSTLLGHLAAREAKWQEKDRSEIPKAEETPNQVLDSKHLDDQAPAVAKLENDETDKPLDPGLSDLGWSEDPKIPIPILHGLKNEDVWQLVRRFNKQTYHVKQIPEAQPQGGIDMNIADKDEFTPDKLRSTLERLYMTIGISLASFVTHIARVRSWNEKRRTTFFLIIYSMAWFFNYLLPIFSIFIIILLVSPKSRNVLFPHAPLAAINAKTGNPQVPKAGHLGSDSITGAKESFKGEAVEQEATNLVGSVTHLAVASAIGTGQTSTAEAKKEQGESDDDSEEDEDGDEASKPRSLKNRKKTQVLDPAKSTVDVKEAQGIAKGEKPVGNQDHTEEAVDKAVWSSAQPILHTLEDIADTWERFGNALSPTAPFAQHGPRVKIACLFLPIALTSLFVTSQMVYRFTTLLMGFLFFGQPILKHASIQDLIKLLDEKVPDWKRYLELRNSILLGVPTNAQLTLTLLRIGEVNKSPLPPPPPSVSAPEPMGKDGQRMAEEMPPEYEEEMKKLGEKHEVETGNEADSTKEPKKRSRFMALFKGTTKVGVNTTLTANSVKATIGSEHSKQRIGVIKTQIAKEAVGDGPASFKARCHGKRGLLLISTTATTPCVSFEKELRPHTKALIAAAEASKRNDEKKQDQKIQQGHEEQGDAEGHERDDGEEDGKNNSKTTENLRKAAEKSRPSALFSIAIDEIVGIKKLGGLGWKGKLIVGFALEKEIADGLELEIKTGEKFIVTALPRRDEVFNRLVAMSGERKWEMW